MGANITLLMSDREDTLAEVFPHDPEQTKGMASQWSLTRYLVIFLNGVIQENEMGKVIPWVSFRGMINAIYNDMIEVKLEMQTVFN